MFHDLVVLCASGSHALRVVAVLADAGAKLDQSRASIVIHGKSLLRIMASHRYCDRVAGDRLCHERGQQQTLAWITYRARLIELSRLISENRNDPERVRALIAQHDEI